MSYLASHVRQPTGDLSRERTRPEQLSSGSPQEHALLVLCQIPDAALSDLIRTVAGDCPCEAARLRAVWRQLSCLQLAHGLASLELLSAELLAAEQVSTELVSYQLLGCELVT